MSGIVALILILAIFCLKAIKSKTCLAVGGSTVGLHPSGILTRSASVSCPITTTGCIYLYNNDYVYGYFDMTQYAGIVVQFDYKITGYVYGSNEYTRVSYKCGTGSTTIGYIIHTSYNNANFNTRYRKQFNLSSSCDYSSNSTYIRIEQNSYNSVRLINIENVCLFGSTTTEPTTEPTTGPTTRPTTVPSKAPTYSLRTPTMYVAMQNINDVGCKDLGLSYNVIYNGNYKDCVDECKIDSECIITNYLRYVKTQNDSRCYMYKKICEMKNYNNNNQSIISYITNDFNCQSYPINWQDRIGDTCRHYNYYDWCVNSKPNINNLNNIYNFGDKNGLNGIDVCCNCGGGIYNYDNIKLVYFNEDNYKRFDNNNVSQSTLALDTQIKSWNNLILYDIMNNNNINPSSNFDDLLFLDSNKFIYNIYFCELNNNIGYISDYFIYIKQNNNIFINKQWSNIKRSSFINLIPYLHCLDNINFTLPLIGVSVANVSNMYYTDIPTTITELKNKKKTNYKAGFIVVTIIMCLLIIALILFTVWYFHQKMINGNEYTMKCIFKNDEYILITVNKTDTVGVLKILIAQERKNKNGIDCKVSSLKTQNGTKLSDVSKTLKDYGITPRTAIINVKTR